jgi:hypothetical protein
MGRRSAPWQQKFPVKEGREIAARVSVLLRLSQAEGRGVAGVNAKSS